VLDREYKSNDDRIVGLGDLIEAGENWQKDNATAYQERMKSVTLDDTYTILYTSGTTGQGKGVILTHWCAITRMLGTNEFWARYGMSLSENDIGLCFLPLSHIYDRGSLQLTALINGATIAYADKPGTLLEDMQKYNPTWINCVPRLYEKIYITFQQQMAENATKKKLFDWALKVGTEVLEYRKDDKGTYNMSPDFNLLSKLPFGLKLKYKIADKLFAKVRALFGSQFRFSFSASAGIASDLLKFYYTIGIAVCEGYGSTESFNACLLNPITNCKPGFVGINANGGFARIAEDGELELSGAGMFSDYLNKKDETKESFTKDKWFKTGDLVTIDEFGYYKIVDRKKAIICTAVGKNIAPAKIENQFSTSNVVEQIFLIGDERNFISALIVPSYAYFIDYFDKNGIEYDKNTLLWSDASGANVCMGVGEDFINQPVVQAMIDEDIKRGNEKLEGFERVKQFTVLKERFSEENGQLTPTQKTKKRVILETYADDINEMYK
jgi:long-chain acyl-CoA synthetase